MAYGLIGVREHVDLAVGWLMVLATGPFVGVVVGSTVVWEAIDRGFAGGLVESNNELSGFLFRRVIPMISRVTEPVNRRLVKHPEDAWLVNFCAAMAIGLPLWLRLFGQLHQSCESLTSMLALCWCYHVVRIGPFFMNFAYVYASCHKEGHAAAARNGLFAPPFDKKGPFRHVLNWWIGLYYGVLPASFAVGHSINHHKYNNGPADVLSTVDKPRDNWLNLICYVPRFALYACNISTTYQFYLEGKYRVAVSTVLGTLYYVVFCMLVGKLYGGMFAFLYLVYPFFEQALLLAGINWVWHAFLDPDEIENEYVQSITILGGTVNVLNEDSHVVHHQYPGSHWTRHPDLLAKHDAAYGAKVGSVFYGTHTFELLALILMADYDKLADRFLGHMPENGATALFGDSTFDKTKVERPKSAVSHAEAVELMKARLRCCWWGPRAPDRDAKLLSADAGQSFTFAHEWEDAPGQNDGFNNLPSAPAAAEPVAAKKRSARSPGKKRV